MKANKNIEKEIVNSFANIATTIGYSDIHGKIIAELLVKGEPMSLKELSKKIGCSLSTISLSLDLLDVFGIIRKIKKSKDRNLYIELQGSLLKGLKTAFLVRIENSIHDTLEKFELYEKELKKSKNKKSLKALKILKNEIKKLERYMKLLNKISIK
ncbi:MAG: hypothetical protein J7K26_01010 [Candidatus Aenigmarchaeota archaeon]|nr:hypothetical protein [Candidatus Aenigmarchaeota archaeon]